MSPDGVLLEANRTALSAAGVTEDAVIAASRSGKRHGGRMTRFSNSDCGMLSSMPLLDISIDSRPLTLWLTV